jgi:acyl-CoA synthetase (AMP-forming)/AMP-acid ligase II
MNHGAPCLGVALLEEAIELRQAGITLPILVFGGVATRQIPQFIAHGLMMAASSIDKLRQIDDADILPDDAVLLSSLPVFHSFGFTIGLWYSLSRSPRLVTLPSPLDSAAAVKTIKEEKVTVVVGTPTFLRPYLRRGTAESEPRLRGDISVNVSHDFAKNLSNIFRDKMPAFGAQRNKEQRHTGRVGRGR